MDESQPIASTSATPYSAPSSQPASSAPPLARALADESLLPLDTNRPVLDSQPRQGTNTATSGFVYEIWLNSCAYEGEGRKLEWEKERAGHRLRLRLVKNTGELHISYVQMETDGHPAESTRISIGLLLFRGIKVKIDRWTEAEGSSVTVQIEFGKHQGAVSESILFDIDTHAPAFDALRFEKCKSLFRTWGREQKFPYDVPDHRALAIPRPGTSIESWQHPRPDHKFYDPEDPYTWSAPFPPKRLLATLPVPQTGVDGKSTATKPRAAYVSKRGHTRSATTTTNYAEGDEATTTTTEDEDYLDRSSTKVASRSKGKQGVRRGQPDLSDQNTSDAPQPTTSTSSSTPRGKAVANNSTSRSSAGPSQVHAPAESAVGYAALRQRVDELEKQRAVDAQQITQLSDQVNQFAPFLALLPYIPRLTAQLDAIPPQSGAQPSAAMKSGAEHPSEKEAQDQEMGEQYSEDKHDDGEGDEEVGLPVEIEQQLAELRQMDNPPKDVQVLMDVADQLDC